MYFSSLQTELIDTTKIKETSTIISNFAKKLGWIWVDFSPSLFWSRPSPWGSAGTANHRSSHLSITLANQAHSPDAAYGAKTHRQAVEVESLSNPSISPKFLELAWVPFFATPEGWFSFYDREPPQHLFNKTYFLTSVYFCNLKSKNPDTNNNRSMLKYVHWSFKLFSNG